MPNDADADAARERARARALSRTKFLAFLIKAFETVHPGQKLARNWHIKLLCWHLSRARNGEIKRLILCLCPRSLKSFIASVAFPAWCLGNDPTKKFICISYAEDLATKHSRDFQKIVQAPWYRKRFPNTRFDKMKFTEREVCTTKNGFRLATSVGGTLTGRGGDYIIIDDPIKADAAMSEAERNSVNNWYTSTPTTRFDNPNQGVMIIVSQRTHHDDLVGHVVELEEWTNVSIPAIATETEEIQIGENKFITREKGEPMHPARMGLGLLEDQRRTLGTNNFEAQFQQNPLPFGGNLIKAEWLRDFDPHRPPEFDLIVQSWDTASTVSDASSYSVGLTIGVKENRYHLIDVFRDKLEFADLKHAVVRRARVWGADRILIEKAASGLSLLQMLQNETNLPLIPVPPEGDKITRVERVSAYIEMNRLYLPTDAPWPAEFQREILAFPNGKHDDQVDALAHFLIWAIHRDHDRPPRAYVIGGDTGVRDHYWERTGIRTF